MASKKLKRVGKAAAAIGAAYLASQALDKNKPKAKAKQLFGKTKIGDDFGSTTAATKFGGPKDTFASDMAAEKELVPASKFLTTPGGFSSISPATPEQVNEQMDAFGPMAKDGKFISKKMMDGGSVISRGNKLARSKPTKLF